MFVNVEYKTLQAWLRTLRVIAAALDDFDHINLAGQLARIIDELRKLLPDYISE